MPRFFFNIAGESPDPDGVELPDRQSARGEAVRAAGEILRDLDGAISEKEWTMTVQDAAGKFVLEIRLAINERSAS